MAPVTVIKLARRTRDVPAQARDGFSKSWCTAYESDDGVTWELSTIVWRKGKVKETWINPNNLETWTKSWRTDGPRKKLVSLYWQGNQMCEIWEYKDQQ